MHIFTHIHTPTIYHVDGIEWHLRHGSHLWNAYSCPDNGFLGDIFVFTFDLWPFSKMTSWRLARVNQWMHLFVVRSVCYWTQCREDAERITIEAFKGKKKKTWPLIVNTLILFCTEYSTITMKPKKSFWFLVKISAGNSEFFRLKWVLNLRKW